MVNANKTGLFEMPSITEQERMVEAILFASKEPVEIQEFVKRMPHGSDPLKALKNLKSIYEGRGVNLNNIGNAWVIRTAPDLGFLMRSEVIETRKLSRAAIETLSIIAYHQPVSRAEIEEIRGVSVSRGTLDLLIEIEWIRLGRRRTTPGRPVTFIITQKFLDHFGLSSLKDLPGLKEMRAAGLLESRPPPGTSLNEEISNKDNRDAEEVDFFEDDS